jgi:wyosine [tRNA(Phe)-imidazoG37] synthetase (radical SAM superfamily)
VITNGSLLFQPEVRQDLSEADVLIPSLDAGSQEIFSKINRPHRAIEFEVMLQGQMDWRREYRGQIWLEVMLVQGVNDTKRALRDIRSSIDKIQPDRIYLTTPIRPPAESWVKPPSPEKILRAQEIIGKPITIDTTESGAFGLAAFDNARQAILEIGSRHPLRLEQAFEIENNFSQPGTIDNMLKDKELYKVPYNASDYLIPGCFLRART